ncbi:MAG: hypothetical protein ABUJ92_00165 [Desulfobacterales bacterium]
MLKEPSIEVLDDYKAVVNGQVVWIENYPYAYGSRTFDQIIPAKERPSRKTIFMLHDAIEKTRKP